MRLDRVDLAVLKRAVNKARHSPCKYKVVAIGFDKRHNVLGVVTNRSFISRFGGSIHAEARAIAVLNNLASVLVFRVNARGQVLPMDPCPRCTRYAARRRVAVSTIK